MVVEGVYQDLALEEGAAKLVVVVVVVEGGVDWAATKALCQPVAMVVVAVVSGVG